MSDVIENAVKWAVDTATDETHGYDQTHRWGNDYDCSSFVITAYDKAGTKVKTYGATYTGNMYNAFIKSGFKDVTTSVNLSTAKGLERGDVLLIHNKYHQHTAIYCGNLCEVEASINEKGKTTGGTTGDQTGREIYIRNYRPNFYTTVLRYTGNSSSDSIDKIARDVIAGKYGNGAVRKRGLEEKGYNYLQVQKRVNQIIRGY